MPTMTKKEFYRRPAAPNSLRGSEKITVIDNGRPQFEVTAVGRSGKSGAQYHREAMEMFPGKATAFDAVKILRDDER